MPSPRNVRGARRNWHAVKVHHNPLRQSSVAWELMGPAKTFDDQPEAPSTEKERAELPLLDTREKTTKLVAHVPARSARRR
jgi:hypothetical protein